MNELPEELRQALKKKTVVAPPESFYTDVLRKIRTAPEPRSRWAWMWGTPAKFTAALGVVMISYFAIQDQTRWGSKKAELVYDQVSSAENFIAMPKDKASEKNQKSLDAPVFLKKSASANTKGMTFPWQSSLQAKQWAPTSSTVGQLASVSTPQAAASVNQSADDKRQIFAMRDEMKNEGLNSAVASVWKGTTSAMGFSQTAVITTATDWKIFWRSHQGSAATPPVDFNQWMIIGVFAGTRPDLAALDIVDVQSLPGQIIVTYREILRPQEPGIALSDSRPYELRAIPKSSLPIHFKKIS